MVKKPPKNLFPPYQMIGSNWKTLQKQYTIKAQTLNFLKIFKNGFGSS
jgi:hypothetical protein